MEEVTSTTMRAAWFVVEVSLRVRSRHVAIFVASTHETEESSIAKQLYRSIAIILSSRIPCYLTCYQPMAANIGAQAASAVDEKIREFRTLQTELNTHQSDLGTLMAQRNENEMVKQVSIDCLVVYSVDMCCSGIVYWLFMSFCAYHLFAMEMC